MIALTSSRRIGFSHSFASQGLAGRLCEAMKREMSSISANEALTKNSKLRAVVISLEVLIGTDELKEFKANLAERRRKDTLEAERPREYDTSKEIQGVTTVQTKYMNKIKAKLGKRDAKPIARGKGDSALLQVGREMIKTVALENEENTKGGSSVAWLLQLGMGNLLDYLTSRSVSIALFPTFNSDDALMNDFLAQVQMPFVHVEPNLAIGIKKQKTSKDQYAARRINKLFSAKSSEAAFTDLDPKQVMLISTDDSLLRAARDAGMLTCKYRLPNGLRGQVSTHFTATAALEVQDALEELNGIAYRNTAHSSRSYF